MCGQLELVQNPHLCGETAKSIGLPSLLEYRQIAYWYACFYRMKGKSQDERGLGVEKLWEILDSRRQGQIDLKDFKKGLKQIDHRTFFSFLSSGQKSGR
jgi:hypothetical protein